MSCSSPSLPHAVIETEVHKKMREGYSYSHSRIIIAKRIIDDQYVNAMPLNSTALAYAWAESILRHQGIEA